MAAPAKEAQAKERRAKEAAERFAAARRALQDARARAEALARDLDKVQRGIEFPTVANGETTRTREEAMRATHELQHRERERDALERELAAQAKQAKEAAERSAAAEQALQEERARAGTADPVSRHRPAQDRVPTEAAGAASGETAKVSAAQALQLSQQQERDLVAQAKQAKQATERFHAAEKALQEERTRAETLGRDLDTARRQTESLIAAASAASGEAARAKKEATRGAEELQRSGEQGRARAERWNVTWWRKPKPRRPRNAPMRLNERCRRVRGPDS